MVTGRPDLAAGGSPEARRGATYVPAPRSGGRRTPGVSLSQEPGKLARGGGTRGDVTRDGKCYEWIGTRCATRFIRKIKTFFRLKRPNSVTCLTTVTEMQAGRREHLKLEAGI